MNNTYDIIHEMHWRSLIRWSEFLLAPFLDAGMVFLAFLEIEGVKIFVMSNRLMAGFYHLSEWITRLAYLNILWILFSLSGLVIFSIFPATAALFTVARHWVLGDEGVPIFKTFWNSFKENFFRVQFLGYTLALIGGILYFDYRYFLNHDGIIYLVAKLITGTVIFLFFIILLYIFPVYTHYKLKTFQYLKDSLFIGVSHLFHSIGMLLVSGIFIYAFLKYSSFLVLFVVSLLAYWITWVAHNVFKRIEQIKLKNV